MYMKISLPDLKFSNNALEPYISERTIEFHHGKHHNAYVQNTINLITGTDLENESLEKVIETASKDQTKVGIFNNAAQVWNHSFYWNCIKPNGGGAPDGKIAELLNDAFGSYDNFADNFKNAGMTQFGSGWAWLVKTSDNTLSIVKTANADTPIVHKRTPLITVDVWEHAYYLDYQNRRPDYLDDFLNYLINWDFVNSLLD